MKKARIVALRDDFTLVDGSTGGVLRREKKGTFLSFAKSCTEWCKRNGYALDDEGDLAEHYPDECDGFVKFAFVRQYEGVNTLEIYYELHDESVEYKIEKMEGDNFIFVERWSTDDLWSFPYRGRSESEARRALFNGIRQDRLRALL